MSAPDLVEAEVAIACALAIARIKRQFPDMADKMTANVLPDYRDMEDAQAALAAHSEWMKAQGLVVVLVEPTVRMKTGGGLIVRARRSGQYTFSSQARDVYTAMIEAAQQADGGA